MSERRYWLMKVEPEAYTIEALERDGTTVWEGVRNYQARNFLKEMRVGDRVLFYASSADPSGVTGVAEVSREAHPDPTAWQKGHTYYDPKSTQERPTWFRVAVRFVERFPSIVALDTLKQAPGLKKMMVVQPGRRPSVQPVTPQEYEIVLKLGRGR